MANSLATAKIDERHMEPISMPTLDELQVELLPERNTMIELKLELEPILKGLAEILGKLFGK